MRCIFGHWVFGFWRTLHPIPSYLGGGFVCDQHTDELVSLWAKQFVERSLGGNQGRKPMESGIYADLAARGVVKAVVHFSGGGDEGGTDNIVLVDADGNQTQIEESWEEAKTPDDDLAEKLAEPVYAEYGGFAGDFYVKGTVTYDVKARTAKMDKSEQGSWDHAEYEL